MWRVLCAGARACAPLSAALFHHWHAREKQSEVTFHYAQQHNPCLCNSLFKSLLLVFPWSWQTSIPKCAGLYTLARFIPPNFLPTPPTKRHLTMVHPCVCLKSSRNHPLLTSIYTIFNTAAFAELATVPLHPLHFSCLRCSMCSPYPWADLFDLKITISKSQINS